MAYPNKIGVPRLNVEIQEIEDDPVRKITEAAIIDNQSLPCINHLYVIEILFLHSLELRYSRRDSTQVVFDSIIRIPTHILTRLMRAERCWERQKDSRQVKIS